MSFESPFISKDVEMGHKSTRMYIGFTVSPKVCQVTSTDAPLKFSYEESLGKMPSKSF